jgi:hypothetical protein
MKALTKYIPTSVTQAVGRQVLKGRKNSPTILFVGGIVGVVATTVLASRATLKLDGVLDDTQKNLEAAKKVSELGRKDYSDDDYKKDVIYIYARATTDVVKLYTPAVLVGFASIAALTGSHHILSKRNAGLTAAYAALDRAFGDYRKRVVDEYGIEKDREFRYELEDRKVIRESDGKEVTVRRIGPNEPSGYARFFDQLNPNWKNRPEYNLLFIKCQQNWANDVLRARGFIFLNEVYDNLGIEHSSSGAVVGWVIGDDGDNYVDFGIFDGNNAGSRDFVNGRNDSILLDFNVDGVIYDKIDAWRRMS